MWRDDKRQPQDETKRAAKVGNVVRGKETQVEMKE